MVDYKARKNNTTGCNLLLKALPKLSFRKSLKKKTPTTLKGFSNLGHAHRNILLTKFFNTIDATYNKTIYYYAMQIQRYSRRVDQEKYNAFP